MVSSNDSEENGTKNKTKYMKIISLILNFYILNNPQQKLSLFKVLWNVYLFSVYIVIFPMYVLTNGMNIYHYKHETAIWTDSLLVQCGVVITYIIVVTYHRQRTEIISLLHELNNELWPLEQGIGFSAEDVANIEKRTRKIIGFLFAFWVTPTLLPYAPLIANREAANNTGEVYDIHKPGGSYRSRLWFPFDVTDNTVSSVLAITEIMLFCFACLSMYSCCAFISGFGNHMAMRFSLLQQSLRNIRQDAQKETADEKRLVLKNRHWKAYVWYIQRKRGEGKDDYADTILIRRFQLCIQYHQKLNRFCNRLSPIVSPLAMGFILETLSICCLSSFQVSVSESLTFETSIFTFISCLLTFSLMSICWYCSEISKQSEGVVQAVYESDWLVCPQIYKTSLLTMMIGANKKIVMSAGGLTAINMKTAIEVLRVTYSFFTVLRGTNDHTNMEE